MLHLEVSHCMKSAQEVVELSSTWPLDVPIHSSEKPLTRLTGSSTKSNLLRGQCVSYDKVSSCWLCG